MKKIPVLLLFFLFATGLWGQNSAQNTPASVFTHFITVSGDRLMDGNQEYRFISFNVPNLHCIEDNMIFTEMNVWRLPDDFEIADALKSIQQMGGRAVRMYVLTVQRKDDGPEAQRYVLGPGKFNETAFQTLDRVLAWANQIGVRVIIPFVDNWSWMGGIAEYAGFRNQPGQAFWTDPQIKADFKKTVEFLITRTNTITGIQYKDDKAILAWETGNELLNCPDAWTSEMAQYIKKLDKNHLVLDGYHTSVLRPESVTNPYTDIVTTHHYEENPIDMMANIKQSADLARGKKPYLVGEFGWLGSRATDALLDQVIKDKEICGALIWSLRFHNRDGGFYWHSEPAIGGLFKAYHYPGFSSGASYDEINLLKVMKARAFEIQGLPVPALPIPEPPRLLPTSEVARLSWQGSVGASSYQVERAESPDGPWQVVARQVSDAAVAYQPLFNDESASIGAAYYYRVAAENAAGRSQASNIIGPIQVSKRTLVDEITNYGLMFNKKGPLSLESHTARQFKEDWHRVRGEAGAEIVYFAPANIVDWRIFCFATDDKDLLQISMSADGKNYHPVPFTTTNYFIGIREYDYLMPLLLSFQSTLENQQFLKIRFLKKSQISRVELSYEQ